MNAAKTACTRLAAHGDWLAERVAILCGVAELARGTPWRVHRAKARVYGLSAVGR